MHAHTRGSDPAMAAAAEAYSRSPRRPAARPPPSYRPLRLAAPPPPPPPRAQVPVKDSPLEDRIKKLFVQAAEQFQVEEDAKAEIEAKEATKRLYANTGAADGRGYEAPPPAEEDPLFVY